MATCKHFAANDFEDWNGANRHNFNAKITLQDLAEYCMMPFQQCAGDSKVGSIMCAYNAVNGVPSCANKYSMDTILRGHWNWTKQNNYITSDYEAVLDVSANHHSARTNAEGRAMCLDAGIDTSCDYSRLSDIPGAWRQGLRVNACFTQLGDVKKHEAQQAALQVAVEYIVLLKNDGTLPLDLKQSSKVAMINFWADALEKLSGGYSWTPYFSHTPVYAARQMGLDVKADPPAGFSRE